ncbi:MAG TPA: HD domain-containing protein [Victivallales bacterium]|nr:HD domain-containing protein [Victivallales bacterium]
MKFPNYNFPEECQADTKLILCSLKRKDSYSLLHSVRVSSLAVKIASKMGFDANFVKELANAALLHDIGKIAIKKSILDKKAPLNHDEYEIMKKHTLFDAEKYFKKKFPQSVKLAIRQHHEREDGSGYPFSLKSADISIVGKICAVADSYDAIVSERPYHKAETGNNALAQITLGAGKIYDEKIVTALTELFQ